LKDLYIIYYHHV